MILEPTKDNIASKRLKTSLIQKLIIIGFISLISLTFFRCANMQRPTGGPKDSLPPKILNESPANYTRNFDAKDIMLTMDEYIKLNNQFKEFSISPDLEKQPEYKIKKKTLHIRLPDSLETNTTYTINFGKGLVDYNEGNPILNYNYVFSTGPELDSLQISGSVRNAYTKVFDEKIDKDVKVLLIPTRQDSIFGKRKANIFTLVDSSGNFTFRNLREDTYRIYALKEQNNDRIYNNPEEAIGFILDSIVLNRNIDDIKIEYSVGKPTKFRTIEKKIEKNSRILLTFNQPLDSPLIKIIEPIIPDNEQKISFSNYKDSSFIFLKKLDFDSIKFELSDMNIVLDTILLRRSKNEKYERIIEPQLNIENKVDKIKHITLTSLFPIENIDKSKITINEDSTSRRNFQLQQDSINKNIYHIRYNWKPKKDYELVLEEKAILSPFEDFNKEFKTKFTLDESENYGDIKFKITGIEPNIQYIVQLTDDKKEKVFDTRYITNSDEIIYQKFPGGKYILRVIKDLNKNKRWDGADVYNKIQAEPIWYLDKPFTIRANWEQNENIVLQFE
ncbi:Ig-like domain-containing protein [Sphingobacterium sp. C459-1T]|uniref:Ig-like domain-containing protein n=2 Tax=Sphingobacterium faecale TaxID=2803775 RepID=A0ABS1R9H5_9SPHI|nr:Ig-like domain-containing protein [Sphingobacterium faecale]